MSRGVFQTRAHIAPWQSWALSLLLCPIGLTHEHLPVSKVEDIGDWRLFCALGMWFVLGTILYSAIVTLHRHRHQSCALASLVFLIVPFLPASHVRGLVASLAVFQGMAEIGGRRLFSALRFLSRSERYFFLHWAPR